MRSTSIKSANESTDQFVYHHASLDYSVVKEEEGRVLPRHTKLDGKPAYLSDHSHSLSFDLAAALPPPPFHSQSVPQLSSTAIPPDNCQSAASALCRVSPLSTVSTASATGPLTLSERKRRRVEKHREVDAVRRSREAKALSTLLQVLREEQLLQDSAAPKRAKSSTAPRSRAQVLETAVSRLRSMRALLSAQQAEQPSPVAVQPSASVTSSSSTAFLSLLSSSTSSPSSVTMSVSPVASAVSPPSVVLSWSWYESLFRCSPNHGMLISCSSRQCVSVSSDFCSYTGYTSTQVVGTVMDLCPLAPHSADYGLLDCRGASGAAADSCQPVDVLPDWQVALNRQQLMALLSGRERRVQCLFRIVRSDQSHVDGWFQCWTLSHTNQHNAPTTDTMLVLHTQPEHYIEAH